MEERTRSQRWYRFYYRLIAPFLRLFHRIRAEGLENLPEGAVILCPNHTALGDPLYVGCVLTPSRPILPFAKAELRRIPLVGKVLESVGTVFVDRGSADVRAVKAVLQALKEGKTLLIFPEGTRVKNGLDKHGKPVRPKEGAALFATRTGAPLVPVWITARRPIFHTVRVVFGKPYHPETADRRATSQELTAITEDLMARVSALGEGER